MLFARWDREIDIFDEKPLMGSDDKVNDSSDNHPLTSYNQQTIVFNEHLHAEAITFACIFADLLRIF